MLLLESIALITVWLQVQILPGPPFVYVINSRCYAISLRGLEKNLRAVPNNSPNEIVRFPFGYSLVMPNTVTEDRNERTSMDMAARYP